MTLILTLLSHRIAVNRRQLSGWPVISARRLARLGCLVAALALSGGRAFSEPARALSWSALAEPSSGRIQQLGNSGARLFALEPSPAKLDLGLRFPGSGSAPPLDLSVAPETAGQVRAPRGEPQKLWIGVVSAVTILGSAENSFGDGPNQKFHFTNEGFFGQYTYAGGGDKASHFVSYYGVARLLTPVYEFLDVSPDESFLLAAGVSAFAGFVTELGDGRGHYGFSYEDMLFDSLGAATSLALSHYQLNDLIGFRFGTVPAPEVPPDLPYGGFGKDYSKEIYTGDLKISGLATRMHFNPGPARFLYLSLTYSSKGYPYGAPDVRERQIGIEIGLHITEVMRAVGIPEDKWYTKPFYVVLDLVRIRYTQIGMYFDLNHSKWHGPSIGDSYPVSP